MRNKVLVLTALSLFSLVFAGCDGGRAEMAPHEVNVLGIVKYEESVYRHNRPGGFHGYTNELWSRRNPSGDRLSLLWDFATLSDY